MWRSVWLLRSTGTPPWHWRSSTGRETQRGPGMTAKLLETREIAPDVRHFVFQVEDGPISYVPGQFASLTAEIEGSPITRAYSFASPARGSRFDLCLNRVNEGKFSPYLFDLQPGD